MRKTELQLTADARKKVVRSLVRLKHSLDADREVNARLAEEEEKYQKAIAGGGGYVLDVKALVDDVDKDSS